MKLALSIFILSLSWSSWSKSSFAFIANTAKTKVITTKIHQVLLPERGEKNILILVKTGDVLELDESQTSQLNAIFFALRENIQVKIRILDLSVNHLIALREHITDVDLVLYSRMSTISDINSRHYNDYNYQRGPTPLDDYIFTTISSLSKANQLFKTQRNDTRRRSQCYNRAHVWAYNLDKKNIKSGKIWLFFNKRYIREYNYKWWFHVSPYVQVNAEGEEIIMDREFTSAPLALTKWKNIFMKNHAPCPVVDYYSDYRDNFWNGLEYCFFIKSSMYYWMPRDIEALEQNGPQKKSWIKGELKTAYRNAIYGWNGEL